MSSRANQHWCKKNCKTDFFYRIC